MTTLLEHKTTLSYLAYLGFNEEPVTAALKIIAREDLRKRSVFQCNVFGATGSGKTCLLKKLVNKKFNAKYKHQRENYAAVNSVDLNGSERYLVLKECQDSSKVSQSDVDVYVYDSNDPHSFMYVADLFLKNSSNSPSLFVSTKTDLDLVQQKSELAPDLFCKKYGINMPLSVSVKEDSMADLYLRMMRVAIDPTLMPKRKTRKTSVLMLVGLSAGIAACSLILYKLIRTRK